MNAIINEFINKNYPTRNYMSLDNIKKGRDIKLALMSINMEATNSSDVMENKSYFVERYENSNENTLNEIRLENIELLDVYHKIMDEIIIWDEIFNNCDLNDEYKASYLTYKKDNLSCINTTLLIAKNEIKMYSQKYGDVSDILDETREITNINLSF